VNLDAHLATIRSYLNEYKTFQGARNDISSIFVKYIITSCWPKMYRRIHSWSSLNLIKQICSIDYATIQSLSLQSAPPPVQLDISFLNFLEAGWNIYLPDLLDHHPNVEALSTDKAPHPQVLLDAIKSKGTYAYSADVAINFHNLLTSFLVAYIICLDYVDSAMWQLDG
jgi:hypothetical protein